MDETTHGETAGATPAGSGTGHATTHHRRRRALWIGVPVAVVAIGAVVTSLALIAPGTAVAGVSVGGMTPAAAATAIRTRLGDTRVDVTADGAHATLSAAQLGATVDAAALAQQAERQHPAWNVTSWFAHSGAGTVTVNAAVADAALQHAAPTTFHAARDAAVRFDAHTGAFVAVPGRSGAGVDTARLAASLQAALRAGDRTATLSASSQTVAPAVTTATATAEAASLNAMAAEAGFYVGDQRAVPVTPAMLASWLTVTPRGHGFHVTVDRAAVASAVAALPAKINRAPQNGTDITTTTGTVIFTQTPTLAGRTLGSTTGVAAAYATRLAAGDGTYRLPVTTTPATTTKISRNIVVSLTHQTASLYQNGTLVKQYPISSGKPSTPTAAGSYHIFAKVPLQNMGCGPTSAYCTTNVPWVSYFYPNVGFHGAYWNHDLGTPLSHGCINMRGAAAKFVYDWAPIGTQVLVEK